MPGERQGVGQNPDLLGPLTRTAPKAFEGLVVAAVGGEPATAAAQILIGASVGMKHQVETREAYRIA